MQINKTVINYKGSSYLAPSPKLNQKQQSFGGVGDVLTAGLQTFDKYPMIGVSFIDTVSTNIPRTVVDLKTGIPAALETARREFSGLFVNCLMPSFIVLGVAKKLNPQFQKHFKGIDMAHSWANQSVIEFLSPIYKHAKKSGEPEKVAKEFARETLSKLEGLDGKTWVKFSDKIGTENFEKAVDILGNTISRFGLSGKETKEAISQAHKLIVDETKASEILRVNGKRLGTNLSDLLRDQVDLGRKFATKSVGDHLDSFTKQATKFINKKSLIGLAIIIPLAMSVQALNRRMTRKQFHAKGAPIYKDFGKKNTHKDLSPQEERKFFAQKCLAAGGMVGLALLSMMKKPTMQMFQFKGMFPTVDQCRVIACSTFASRMFAAEDSNELRESTVRDVASFSGLYFLGDYVAKGVATAIEKIKPDVKLLNVVKESKQTDNVFKKFGNWVKNVQLKSFDEISGAGAKNLRSVCQVASILFSIAFLGIALPRYNRSVTEKKVARQKAEEEKMKLEAQKQQPKPVISTQMFQTALKSNKVS
ncbi:hypothetical protein IKQ26_07885 [bacterium]|nr:hypothetical protein [bacterium]